MVAPIRYDWCSYHKRKDTRGGRARRDDVRRGNKTAAIRKSGREAFEEANPVTSRSRTLASRTVRQYTSVVQASPSPISCHGGPS